jgi:hypothetical protein
LPSAGRQQPEQPETLYPDLEWLEELMRRGGIVIDRRPRDVG